jgi:hypothetical protein
MCGASTQNEFAPARRCSLKPQSEDLKHKRWLGAIKRSLTRDFDRNLSEIENMLFELNTELSKMFAEGTSAAIATRLVQATFVLGESKPKASEPPNLTPLDHSPCSPQGESDVSALTELVASFVKATTDGERQACAEQMRRIMEAEGWDMTIDPEKIKERIAQMNG